MKADGFVAAGPAINLKPQARRAFIAAYERRLDQEVTHPRGTEVTCNLWLGAA